MSLIGGAGTHAVLASLFVVTAVLMAPVARAIATELEVGPGNYGFAIS